MNLAPRDCMVSVGLHDVFFATNHLRGTKILISSHQPIVKVQLIITIITVLKTYYRLLF